MKNKEVLNSWEVFSDRDGKKEQWNEMKNV